MNINSCNKVENPARRKIGTTRRSVSGLYPFRGVGPVDFESTLERDFLIRLETDRRVLDVVSQPATIEFIGSNGQTYPYTPDYLVTYRAYPGPYRAPILVEVKPASELDEHLPEWKTKFRAAMTYCKERGYVFHLRHEPRIRDQRWKNAMFLQRYRQMQFLPEESEWIIGNLRQMGTATFDHLLARHFFGEVDRAMGISHLWHLLATARMECDWSQPLGYASELWMPDHD